MPPRPSEHIARLSPYEWEAMASDVAAPVFANVMAGALRLMGIPPDGIDRVPAASIVQASAAP